MSTVFAIITDRQIKTPVGFSNQQGSNCFYYFEDYFYGKTQRVAISSNGATFFQEDYPNKRAYLSEIKMQKATEFSGSFRLKKETVSFLLSLEVGLKFALIDFTEIGSGNAESTSISRSALSDRMIFAEGKYYRLE